MLIQKLYELKERGFFNNVDSSKVELLLQAVTDWPHDVETVEDFLSEIKLFLNADGITEETISSVLQGLNPLNYSWEIESLTCLLELIKDSQNEQLSQVLIECKAIE